MQKNQIQAARWRKIADLMKKENLDLVLVCASLQDFGFGYALSGLRPILYHYLTLDRRSGRLARGYFVPYFLVERLGLEGRPGVVTFDDKMIPAEFGRFLRGKKRVGIVGPAPAAHFSETDCRLVFLDDLLWPLLNRKSPSEIAGVKATAGILADVLDNAGKLIKTGARIEQIAEALDRAVLKKADALAFPSLVEVQHGGRQILSLLGVKVSVQPQDALFINIGAEHNGYFADAGRMYFRNKPLLARQYALLEKAMKAFVKLLRPGLPLCGLPAMLQSEIKRAGLKKARLNSRYIGHSVGFNIINLPYIGDNLFAGEKVEPNTTISFYVEVQLAGSVLKLQETVLIGPRSNAILTRNAPSS